MTPSATGAVPVQGVRNTEKRQFFNFSVRKETIDCDFKRSSRRSVFREFRVKTSLVAVLREGYAKGGKLGSERTRMTSFSQKPLSVLSGTSRLRNSQARRRNKK